MSDPRLQRLTSAENTMIGLATGAIDVSTTQWVLYCKNASQQGDVTQKTYRGVVHAAQTLLKESGPRAFFRGWAWRTGRMVFQCFLFDACKNHLSPVFFPHHFRD